MCSIMFHYVPFRSWTGVICGSASEHDWNLIGTPSEPKWNTNGTPGQSPVFMVRGSQWEAAYRERLRLPDHGKLQRTSQAAKSVRMKRPRAANANLTSGRRTKISGQNRTKAATGVFTGDAPVTAVIAARLNWSVVIMHKC